MKLVVWVVVIFALAAGLGMLARYNHGFVLITYPPYRVELSLNLLVVLTLAAFIALHLTARLAGVTLNLPEKVRSYRLRRARNHARNAMQQALTKAATALPRRPLQKRLR